MKPVDQDQLHDPPDSIGNCFRACIASVFEIDIDEVDIPELEQTLWDGDDWFSLVVDWAWSKDYAVWFWYNSNPHGKQIPVQGIDDRYLIATGPSPRHQDTDHAVVFKGNKLAHDPHPSKSGLDGPPHDFITFVPLNSHDG